MLGTAQGNGHKAARAPGAFLDTAPGWDLGVSVQDQESDWMIQVGPLQVRIFHDSVMM